MKDRGYTLLELAIVIAIMGLLVGSVLAAQELIRGAAVRAQLRQIESYRQAVNTFQVKYGGLPGDLPDPQATSFGFKTRGLYAGEGDGNGTIQSMSANAPLSTQPGGGCGESGVFWVDLSRAGLIPNNFSVASTTVVTNSFGPGGGYLYYLDDLLPRAKLQNDHFIYVFGAEGRNYFGLSSVDHAWNQIYSNTTMRVMDAYDMDKKVDDGLPASGTVTAEYQNASINWAHDYPYVDTDGYIDPGARPVTPPSPTSCMDNNGVNGAEFVYSMSYNGGRNETCGIAFKF